MKNIRKENKIMWSIVGTIWAFILGFIGICIALPIVIALIIGGGYVLFYVIMGLSMIIWAFCYEVWDKIKNIFKKGE